MSLVNGSVFKREEVLFPEYLPEILPYREDKIEFLARVLELSKEGKRWQNVFIHGPPGVGKTAVVKFVFREFSQEFSQKVKTIYINCWDYRSSHAVLSKVCWDCGIFVPRRGVGKDEILERLVEFARKKSGSLAICLDEVDKLVANDEDALYNLLRINQYVENPVTLIFVSNRKHVFADVDPRIYSSLNLEEIEFAPYSLNEMKEILQRRAEEAFSQVESGVVLLAANYAVKNGGDVRRGLECLLKAGRLAESSGENVVRVEHVKKVIKTVSDPEMKVAEEKSDEMERTIIEILKERGEVTSRELYEEFKKRKGNVTDRSIRNYLKRLEKLGVVECRRRRMRGFSRVIRLKS